MFVFSQIRGCCWLIGCFWLHQDYSWHTFELHLQGIWTMEKGSGVCGCLKLRLLYRRIQWAQKALAVLLLTSVAAALFWQLPTFSRTPQPCDISYSTVRLQRVQDIKNAIHYLETSGHRERLWPGLSTFARWRVQHSTTTPVLLCSACCQRPLIWRLPSSSSLPTITTYILPSWTLRHGFMKQLPSWELCQKYEDCWKQSKEAITRWKMTWYIVLQ